MGIQKLLNDDLAQRISGAKTFNSPAGLLVAGQRAKTHFIVKDRDLLTDAALTPAEGDHYLMPASGTILGGWATAGLLNNEIAAYTNNAWQRVTPAEGDTVDIIDDDALLRYSGSAWLARSPVDVAITLAQLGTAANAINTAGKYRNKEITVVDNAATPPVDRKFRALGPLATDAWRPGDDESGASDVIPA